jgi:Na+-driven multidrug efflux pump
MGAAEVATFTIVRTLWDIFASCMEGICCAAEIRCAYFIGTGNISMARITSYKSVMIGEATCLFSLENQTYHLTYFVLKR